jgi:hypothetical protein
LSGFSDLREHVALNVRLSYDWYGETVRYRTRDGVELSLPAHCVHRLLPEIREERTGTARSVEEIRVELPAVGDPCLPNPPMIGDAIYRGDETRPYLYHHGGSTMSGASKDTGATYKARFRREIQTGQGVTRR